MQFWAHFRRERLGLAGLWILALMTISSVVLRILIDGEPLDISRDLLEPPSMEHPMGTDQLGRDVLIQFAYGVQLSLVVGVSAGLLGMLIGVLIGACAGYFGGKIDAVLMRFAEAVQVLPRFILALVAISILGSSFSGIVAIIALFAWPPAARVTRSEFLTIKNLEYVEAARSTGVSPAMIIVREILPNAIPPVIVLTALDIGQAILIEAGLSFLGLGDPNVISLGSMLQSAQRYLVSAWWMSFFPGVGIFLLVVGWSLVGDGINKALNPRARSRV